MLVHVGRKVGLPVLDYYFSRVGILTQGGRGYLTNTGKEVIFSYLILLLFGLMGDEVCCRVVNVASFSLVEIAWMCCRACRSN